MPLTGGDKANRAVLMDLIVPVNKLSHPASSILFQIRDAGNQAGIYTFEKVPPNKGCHC